MSSWRRHVSPVTIVVAGVIIALPTTVGLLRVDAYVVQTPLDMFSLGTEFVALVFPLLAGVVATWRLSGEVGDGYIRSVRTRAFLPRYLATRVGISAATAFAVFFASIFVWFLVALVLDPLIGISHDPGNTYPSLDAALAAAAGRATFSQLLTVSPWLYGLIYASWVGLWAALWAALTAVLLISVPNRIVAYALPLMLSWADNIILANLGLPQWRSTFSAFPFAMTQQPIAVVFAPLAFWLLVAVLLWWRLRATRFETVPLT